MTCEAVREELVAYRDGELSTQEHDHIATHLATCAACSHEEAQLIQMEQLFRRVERITPSPSFSTSFWQRLEQEQARNAASLPIHPPAQENVLSRWWRELRETMTTWQLAPALAAAASVLVFFSYMVMGPSQSPAPEKASQDKPLASSSTSTAPEEVAEKLNFFVNYRMITELERFAHFEEIAAIELPEARSVEVAQEEEVPSDLLQNPSFFTHYPLLKRMEQLKNLEAVLEKPGQENEQNQG